MIIKIGSFVLCHLLVPNNDSTQQSKAQKVEKIPGIVKEIQEYDSFEMVGNSYAVSKRKYNLIVEPKEKDKIFKIGSDACKPIINEADHLEIINKNKATNKDSKKTKEENSKNNELLKELE